MFAGCNRNSNSRSILTYKIRRGGIGVVMSISSHCDPVNFLNSLPAAAQQRQGWQGRVTDTSTQGQTKANNALMSALSI